MPRGHTRAAGAEQVRRGAHLVSGALGPVHFSAGQRSRLTARDGQLTRRLAGYPHRRVGCRSEW
eukprot:4735281-Prymnesium_polylepis.1